MEAVSNGTEMAEILAEGSVDLVLLDLGLEKESGLDLLKQVSAESDVAIVVLTGKSDPIERVVGLELGADDYIVKPFLKRELLARINAVLRRTSTRRSSSDTPKSEKPTRIQVYNWFMDTQKRQVETTDGFRIELTGAEFDLLAALVNNVGEAVSRDELSRSALNREWVPSDRSIDIHIHNLRRKLSERDCSGDVIVAVRNVGYALAAEVKPN